MHRGAYERMRWLGSLESLDTDGAEKPSAAEVASRVIDATLRQAGEQDR